MQTAPPNLLADYLYLRQTAVVKQAIDTARTSVPSGGHSSSYLCQQDSVFAAQDRRLAILPASSFSSSTIGASSRSMPVPVVTSMKSSKNVMSAARLSLLARSPWTNGT